MNTLAALADPTRRRIVELLAAGDHTAGELAAEFSISRPAVSRHLRVLRDAGLIVAEPIATKRLYRLDPQPLTEIDEWLTRHRARWQHHLDALDTELRRGSRGTDASGPDVRPTRVRPTRDRPSHEEEPPT